jgi:Glycosyltransferase family 28 N-terminal domain
MHITIMTIGSRGDVQPFIAFAVGLKKAGHQVRLATHAKFEQEIRAHGLEFALIKGNPAEALAKTQQRGIFLTGCNTCRLSPKIPKYVGWVEERNPTNTAKCWVSQSLNPTYEYP